MMRKHMFLLLVTALVISACAGDLLTPPAQIPAPPVSDPAVAIAVTAGDDFKIVLDANPSTGYHWELDEDTGPDTIEFVSREYVADEPVAPGSGGAEIWTFKALSPGDVQITLGYYPPSNEPTDPQQIQTFTVKVK
jgi:inhibitor of cysteine peptidase